MNKEGVKELFWNFSTARTTDELWRRMESFCELERLVHARVSIYDNEAAISPGNFLHVRSYPDAPVGGQSKTWSQHYIDERLFNHDRSFHLIFEHQTSYMLWSRMDELTRTSSEASRVFTEMRKFGIGEGVLIGLSSLIERRTILLGLAGPSKTFAAYKGELWPSMVEVLKVFISKYLSLAMKEGLVEPQSVKNVVAFTPRELEILKLMSLDKETLEIAEMLGITTNGVNEALKRMRKKGGFKTRAGMLTYAIITKQITPTKD